MRILLILFALSIFYNSFGQFDEISFLKNDGTITYADNSKDAIFTASFQGDSLEILNTESMIFMVDSTVIQIGKWPITENMKNYQYDSTSESIMLSDYWEKEFNYIQRHEYKQKLECNTEFFSNKYSKQFLLKSIRVPDNIKDSSFVNAKNDSSVEKTFIIDYQLHLLFTTNSYVTIISIPVYDEENIFDKIESIKTQIANSIRIYSGYIDFDMLQDQLNYNLKKKPFIVNDTNHGIQFTIPFWLNIGKYDRPYFIGTFPDINNISNALSLVFIPKANFSSYKTFRNNMIASENVKSYERIDSKKHDFLRYKVLQSNKSGEFFCQYVFLELEKYYVLLNFTATENTYNKNIERFNEFVENIRIL